MCLGPIPTTSTGSGTLERGEDALLLEQLGQRAVLVHGDEDVAAADELLVEVELGDGEPVGVLLDACC